MPPCPRPTQSREPRAPGGDPRPVLTDYDSDGDLDLVVANNAAIAGHCLFDDDVIAWHLSSPLTKKQVYQLLELRMAIEPEAAWWAAERAEDNDILELEKNFKKMKKATNSLDDYIKSDALFHRSILDASHNEYFIAFENLIFSSLLISSVSLAGTPSYSAGKYAFFMEVCGFYLKSDKLFDRFAKGDASKTQQFGSGDILRLHSNPRAASHCMTF